MFNLIAISATALMGTYSDLPSCQNAIREIYSQQMNPPGQRLPELEKSIDLMVSVQKSYLCVPVKKGK